MTYHFLATDASVAEGARRIAAICLASAQSRLSAGGEAEAVHDVRKQIKKLRGLIRLIRPGFAGYAEENAELRAAAHALAHLRDSDVLRETLARLDPRGTAFPAAAAALDAHGETAREAGLVAARRAVAQSLLDAIALRVPGWEIRGKGFDTPRRGLEATFAAARAGLRTVRRTPTDEALHDWRKRVKDHLYQIRLITPVWPELMAAREVVADELGEILGRHHDLSVLRSHVGGLALPAEELAALDAAAEAAQAGLLARALPLGARLFAGRPSEMAALWAAWWKVWRTEGG